METGSKSVAKLMGQLFPKKQVNCRSLGGDVIRGGMMVTRLAALVEHPSLVTYPGSRCLQF